MTPFTTAFASTLRADALEDGQWVHLLPLGEAPLRDGRAAVTVKDPRAIIANSQKALDRGIPVDFDHAMERNGSAAPAAGWIEKLEAREDGIGASSPGPPRAAKRSQAAFTASSVRSSCTQTTIARCIRLCELG